MTAGLQIFQCWKKCHLAHHQTCCWPVPGCMRCCCRFVMRVLVSAWAEADLQSMIFGRRSTNLSKSTIGFCHSICYAQIPTQLIFELTPHYIELSGSGHSSWSAPTVMRVHFFSIAAAHLTVSFRERRLTFGDLADVRRNCMKPGGKSKADFEFCRNLPFAVEPISREAVM